MKVPLAAVWRRACQVVTGAAVRSLSPYGKGEMMVACISMAVEFIWRHSNKTS